MNDKTLHEITNEVQQVIGYAGLLRDNDVNKSELYIDLIEQSAYKLDALTRDLFQTKINQIDNVSDDNRTISTSKLLQGKSIMVVDDLKENRDILEEIFRLLKCNVKCAENGKEAINLYKEYNPDIVCMDIIMPGIYGDEATRILKAAGCEAKFIAVSALKEYEERKRAIFDAWLPKPFTIDQIFDILNTINFSDTKKIEIEKINLDKISQNDKNDIIDAIQRGALSELEFTVNSLDKSEQQAWLKEKVSQMELKTIKQVIFSA